MGQKVQVKSSAGTKVIAKMDIISSHLFFLFIFQVFSVDIDGSNVRQVLNVSVESPENLAVDWISNKLYVVETSVDRIDMVDLNGQNRITLIAEDLGNPRGIAVDPTVG